MTTTLTSAGGNSLITDGTGPSLQVVGLAAESGINISSTSTTLSSSLKSIREIQTFADDFNYRTDGVPLNLSWASNPLQASNIWIVTGVTGYSSQMTDVLESPGSGRGVLYFNNNIHGSAFDPLYGEWYLTAPNVPFSIYQNLVTYEARIWINFNDNNYVNCTWRVQVGLRSTSGAFIGFTYDTTVSSNVTAVVGSASSSSLPSIASLMSTWVKLKMIVNAASNQTYVYVNNSFVTLSTSLSGYVQYVPFMRVSRSGDCTPLLFDLYVDYIDITSEVSRYV